MKFTSLAIPALIFTSACSNSASIGNPIGPDSTNFISPSVTSFTFSTDTSAAQKLTLTVAPIGATATESDDCGSGGSRIVNVSTPVSTGSQLFSTTITPSAPGHAR